MPTTLDFSVSKFVGPTPQRFDRTLFKKAVMDLLGTITAPPIGVTLAIPARLKVQNRSYCMMSPDNQYRWLISTYVPKGITHLFNCGIIVPEFHKQGRIHLHMMCWDRSFIDNAYHLNQLRSDVNNTMVAYTIHKGDLSNAVHLTDVHTLDKPLEWIEYLNKSQHEFEGSDIQPCLWVDDQIIRFYADYPKPDPVIRPRPERSIFKSYNIDGSGTERECGKTVRSNTCTGCTISLG